MSLCGCEYPTTENCQSEQKNIVDAIITRTKSGEHCLSVFLISFINSVIKDTFLLEFSYNKTFIRSNFITVSANFISLFMKTTN